MRSSKRLFSCIKKFAPRNRLRGDGKIEAMNIGKSIRNSLLRSLILLQRNNADKEI